jgi:thymidine kinase
MQNNYLKITIGPMFSGKTTSLIRHYKEAINNSKNCIILNSGKDNRYDNYKITTHNKDEYISCIKSNSIEDFLQFYKLEIENADVILIDEAQFFEDIILILSIIKNKYIGIFGLDGDSNQNIFGNIYKLIPYCDEIIKLNGICYSCKKENSSIFSIRIDNSIKKQILIGDNKNYFSVCRNCHN